MRKYLLLALVLWFCSFTAWTEAWVELERVPARSYVGPLHYSYKPGHYETKTENGTTKNIFIAPEYQTFVPIYNKDYDVTRWYVDSSEIIYKRLNKRPSIEVAYEVVTYIGQESHEYKIEFENVEILVH